jgi:hypothetical protein
LRGGLCRQWCVLELEPMPQHAVNDIDEQFEVLVAGDLATGDSAPQDAQQGLTPLLEQSFAQRDGELRVQQRLRHECDQQRPLRGLRQGVDEEARQVLEQ